MGGQKTTTKPVLKGGVGYRKYQGDALWLPNTNRPAWLDGSLPGDYYCPHSILADEMLIPVSFLYGCTDSKDMFLWMSSNKNDVNEILGDISAGVLVEIPLWLAARLDSSGLIEIELPYIYRDSKRKNIKADEDSVSLCGYNDYYCLAGFRLNTLSQIKDLESLPLGTFLFESFEKRFEKMHHSMILSQKELSNDKNRAVSILNKEAIFHRMSMEEKQIWKKQQQQQEKAFL